MICLMMLLLLVLAVFVHQSAPQCLTTKDEVRKVSSAAHDSLLQSELQFSVDLLRTAASLHPEANVLLSPASIFQASLLAYFISANQTEKSLRKALHLADNYDKLDILGAYNLENYYQKLCAVKSRSYQLSSANRLYIAKDLKAQYCMRVLFAEELYPANFQENEKGVVKKINQWVAGQTRNVIKDFLSEDAVSTKTELVLVNAAYFKGKWKSPFNEDDTYQGTFHLSNGSKVTTKMMTQEGEFRYTVDKRLGVEVVELPYTGDDISMLVLLPVKQSPSAIQNLLKKLDGKALQTLVQALSSDESLGPERSVTIPKFTMESELDLTHILESLGVGDLFKNTADLSTLAPGLSFSEAIHKAKIRVNEKRTEAAADTVELLGASPYDYIKPFVANSPFVYTIYDKIRVNEKGTEAAAATSFITARAYIESFNADQPFVYTIYNKVAKVPLFFGVFNHPEPNPS